MIDYNNITHTCSNCGRSVNKYASKCPHCGVKLEGKYWKDGVNPFKKNTNTTYIKLKEMKI